MPDLCCQRIFPCHCCVLTPNPRGIFFLGGGVSYNHHIAVKMIQAQQLSTAHPVSHVQYHPQQCSSALLDWVLLTTLKKPQKTIVHTFYNPQQPSKF